MREGNAHQYTQAIPVSPADLHGPGSWTGYVWDQAGYTAAEALPPGVSALRGYRGAWWTFTADTGVNQYSQLHSYGDTVGVYLDVWRADPAGWVSIGSPPGTTNSDDDTGSVGGFVAGQTYYARVAPVENVEQDQVVLVGSAVYVKDPAAVTPPPSFTGVALSIGPADVGLDAPPPAAFTGVVLRVGPADVGLDALPPATNTDTATPVSPVGAAVPGARPAFIVTVTVTRPDQQVQVQWSADPAFGNVAGTAVGDAPTGLGDAQVAVQPVTDLSSGVIYWRARITGDYGPGPWSDPVQFALNAIAGQAVAAGDFTVAAAAGVLPPHLWYIDHDESGTDSGQRAVIIGTGFGPAPTVLLGATACTVTEVLAVPQAPEHASAPRIEPGVACTPAHQQITFVIPAVDPDHIGDAVTVQRED